MDAASFATPEAEIAALRPQLAARDALLAARDAELRNAGFEIEKLKVQFAALRRDRYGKSSEKLATEIGRLEMLIGDAKEEQAQVAAAAEAKARRKGQPGPSRRPALRKPLPEHLPCETVLHEPVFACRCGCTDPQRLTKLGEDVTEVLEQVPARLRVMRPAAGGLRCCARGGAAVRSADPEWGAMLWPSHAQRPVPDAWRCQHGAASGGEARERCRTALWEHGRGGAEAREAARVRGEARRLMAVLRGLWV